MSTTLAPRPKNEERRIVAVKRTGIIDGKQSDNFSIFCEMAKEEFLMRGIEFEFVNIKEIGKTAAEVTGRDVKTVPQIYYNGDYIGSYDEMMTFFNTGVALEESDECRACEG